jgi:hypothetical protein
MNDLYTFKGKFLLSGFAVILFCYAINSATQLFAARDVNGGGPVPVISLSDGVETKVVSIEDFVKALEKAPDSLFKDVEKVAKLKREFDLSGAQVNLFKKLTEKKEEPFFSSAVKQGVNNLKSMIKGLLKPVISGSTTAIIIGGVAVAVLWYNGYSLPRGGEYLGSRPTKSDYNSMPNSNVDIPKDYIYTRPDGSVVSYKDQLCVDGGWFWNQFSRPSDCPPLK